MGGKLFCSINLGSGEKFVLFVSLLEGAGDVYLFWPPKLGCGHHFFLPTSKYMKGRGSRRGAGTPENITFISYAIVYRYYSFNFKEITIEHR